MAMVRVSILDPSGSKKTQAEVPDNVSAERLIGALVPRLALPSQDEAGRPITYRLAYGKAGESWPLDLSSTLAEAKVSNDDVLRLYAEMQAGGPPWYFGSKPVGGSPGHGANMRIFISWSGPRSQVLARCLHSWIPLVLHYAEPWLSESDVVPGERWAQVLSRELEVSNFGIVCVTRDNLSSPWLLFEAGSLAKSLESGRVVPLLLDVDFSELGGPLSQFQARKVGKQGLGETLLSINRHAGQPVPEARAGQLLEALWPALEAQLALIPGGERSSGPIRSPNEILEDLVASVRSIDRRLEDVESMVSHLGTFFPEKRPVPSLWTIPGTDAGILRDISARLSLLDLDPQSGEPTPKQALPADDAQSTGDSSSK